VVSHDALVPVVTMLERATPTQLAAFAELLRQVVNQPPEGEPGLPNRE
jgi:hypothetical protein